jgi:hypothetical protein
MAAPWVEDSNLVRSWRHLIRTPCIPGFQSTVDERLHSVSSVSPAINFKGTVSFKQLHFSRHLKLAPQIATRAGDRSLGAYVSEIPANWLPRVRAKPKMEYNLSYNLSTFPPAFFCYGLLCFSHFPSSYLRLIITHRRRQRHWRSYAAWKLAA